MFCIQSLARHCIVFLQTFLSFRKKSREIHFHAFEAIPERNFPVRKRPGILGGLKDGILVPRATHLFFKITSLVALATATGKVENLHTM